MFDNLKFSQKKTVKNGKKLTIAKDFDTTAERDEASKVALQTAGELLYIYEVNGEPNALSDIVTTLLKISAPVHQAYLAKKAKENQPQPKK